MTPEDRNAVLKLIISMLPPVFFVIGLALRFIIGEWTMTANISYYIGFVSGFTVYFIRAAHEEKFCKELLGAAFAYLVLGITYWAYVYPGILG